MITCAMCFSSYPEDFYRPHRKKHGVVYKRKQCKFCVEKVRRKRRINQRRFFENYKAKKGCADCGTKDARVLDFHHTNKEDKSYTIGEEIGKGKSNSTLMLEVEKCIVLCANCHRIRHYKEKENYV